MTVPAVRPSVALGSLLVALYVLSDFGVVSLMRYDSLTRAIYLQYRSLFDRTPAAVLALVLVALTAIALALELRARTRGRLWRTGPGAPDDRRRSSWDVARYLALGWCGLVTTAFLRPPGRGPRVLARAGPRERPRAVAPARRGAQLARCLGPRRRRDAPGVAPGRRARQPLPDAALAHARAALVRRERAPRARDRALARLLRRPLRLARLPDARRCSSSRTSSVSSRRRSRGSRRRSGASARVSRKRRADSVAARSRRPGS